MIDFKILADVREYRRLAKLDKPNQLERLNLICLERKLVAAVDNGQIRTF